MVRPRKVVGDAENFVAVPYWGNLNVAAAVTIRNLLRCKMRHEQ